MKKEKKVGNAKKNRKPPTSRKQLRKLGEPRRKMSRVEEKSTQDENELQVVNSNPRPKPGEEGPTAVEVGDGGKIEAGVERPRKSPSPAAKTVNKRQEKRTKKEESRTKRELKAKMRKEKATMRKKKKKEQEETMRKKGEKRTRNQPKIVKWLEKHDGGQRKTHPGGKKGVG